MARIVHLDNHVSRVLSSVLENQEDPGCYVLVLSEVQRSVLRQMTYPYVYWDTRLVEDHRDYQIVVDKPVWYVHELECLEVLLTGGDMSCDLTAVLQALADALAAGHTQNINIGAGCQGMAQCLQDYTNDQLLDTPAADVDPFGETPPPGFDTMDEYRTYKCKAANAVFDWVVGLVRGLQGAGGVQFLAATVGPLIVALLSGLGAITIVFPPTAIPLLIAAVISVGLLSGGAFLIFTAMADYLVAHRTAIVCDLYETGSAAAAQAVLVNAIEDFLQSAEALAFIATLPEGSGVAISALSGLLIPNSVVNPLFQLVEGFVYPGADCSECAGVCQWELTDGFGTIVKGTPFTLTAEEDPSDHFWRISLTQSDACCPNNDTITIVHENRSTPAGFNIYQWDSGSACPTIDGDLAYTTNFNVPDNTQADGMKVVGVDTAATWSVTILIE